DPEVGLHVEALADRLADVLDVREHAGGQQVRRLRLVPVDAEYAACEADATIQHAELRPDLVALHLVRAIARGRSGDAELRQVRCALSSGLSLYAARTEAARRR